MYIRSRFHGREVRYARNRYVVITRRNEGNGGSLARADNIDTNLTAVKRRRFGPAKNGVHGNSTGGKSLSRIEP